MPFPLGKSPQDVAKKVNEKIDHIINDQLEGALTAVIYAIGGNADFYVPVDTNALMNSRETHVTPHKNGYRATLGYYQNYALALHGSATYSPLWKPVDPFEREWRQESAKTFVGNGKGGWNPSARPGWIFMGVAETDVEGMFAEAMKI
tara:strand:- start:111 stop:554 length:444 start_codon:yes stop_codon:yes gene_type:complete